MRLCSWKLMLITFSCAQIFGLAYNLTCRINSVPPLQCYNLRYFLCCSVSLSTSTHPASSEIGWPFMKSSALIGGVAWRKSYCIGTINVITAISWFCILWLGLEALGGGLRRRARGNGLKGLVTWNIIKAEAKGRLQRRLEVRLHHVRYSTPLVSLVW